MHSFPGTFPHLRLFYGWGKEPKVRSQNSPPHFGNGVVVETAPAGSFGPTTAGSADARVAQEPDGGAEHVGRAETAGLGNDGQIWIFASDQPSPGDSCLHLSSQDDTVCAERPARGDGDVAAAEDQGTETGPAQEIPGGPPQELAEGGAGIRRERGTLLSTSGAPSTAAVGCLSQCDHGVSSDEYLSRGLT